MRIDAQLKDWTSDANQRDVERGEGGLCPTVGHYRLLFFKCEVSNTYSLIYSSNPLIVKKEGGEWNYILN